MSLTFTPKIGEIYTSLSMYEGEVLASNTCIRYVDKNKVLKTLEASCNPWGWEVGYYDTFDSKRFSVYKDEIDSLITLLTHLRSN